MKNLNILAVLRHTLNDDESYGEWLGFTLEVAQFNDNGKWGDFSEYSPVQISLSLKKKVLEIHMIDIYKEMIAYHYQQKSPTNLQITDG